MKIRAAGFYLPSSSVVIAASPVMVWLLFIDRNIRLLLRFRKQKLPTMVPVGEHKSPARIESQLRFPSSSFDHRKEQWDGYCTRGDSL